VRYALRYALCGMLVEAWLKHSHPVVYGILPYNRNRLRLSWSGRAQVVAMSDAGSNSRLRPSKFTNRARVDFPEPFGPATTVRMGTLLLGRVRRQFANDFVVFSGRGARYPTNLKFPAILALHHIETIGIDIENGNSGGKGFCKGVAAGSAHCAVELHTTEIVSRRHSSL